MLSLVWALQQECYCVVNLKVKLLELQLNISFFKTVRSFYVTSVSKILTKFPFSDNTIKELAFLDPRNHELSSSTGVVQLATDSPHSHLIRWIPCLCSFVIFELLLMISFLPLILMRQLLLTTWAAMVEVPLVTDLDTLRFGVLSTIAKVLLVIPHSNADPERLFSMIRKIDTEL